VGFSAAVEPYLLAEGAKAAAQVQSARLVALHHPSSGLYGAAPAYYDQNLALFSTGWSEQRYRFESDGRLNVKWK
jgi:endoglucanase